MYDSKLCDKCLNKCLCVWCACHKISIHVLSWSKCDFIHILCFHVNTNSFALIHTLNEIIKTILLLYVSIHLCFASTHSFVKITKTSLLQYGSIHTCFASIHATLIFLEISFASTHTCYASMHIQINFLELIKVTVCIDSYMFVSTHVYFITNMYRLIRVLYRYIKLFCF